MPTLTFILPAFNEGWIIGAAIDAIRDAATAYVHEIIVVDNGSSDDTRAIASERGATVIVRDHGTIGALRNTGVAASHGAVLIFLDADVVVGEAWATALRPVLRALAADARQLTGAMCQVPADAGALERTWFGARATDAFTHIGSGHLLTTRAFFDELGGFDERLETGEDHDLSQRAMAAGGRVVPEPALLAEHHGFPRTVLQFIRREAWHGRSDFVSLRAIVESKVAIATLVFVLLHAMAAATVVLDHDALRNVSLASIAAVCLASSAHKYRRQPARIVLANGVLYYCYYLGRAVALVNPGTRSSRRGDPRQST